MEKGQHTVLHFSNFVFKMRTRAKTRVSRDCLFKLIY